MGLDFFFSVSLSLSFARFHSVFSNCQCFSGGRSQMHITNVCVCCPFGSTVWTLKTFFISLFRIINTLETSKLLLPKRTAHFHQWKGVIYKRAANRKSNDARIQMGKMSVQIYKETCSNKSDICIVHVILWPQCWQND